MKIPKRGKLAIPTNYTTVNLYDEYVKQHKDTPFMVDKATYKELTTIFNSRVADYIIEGKEWTIPGRGGRLQIKKSKMSFTKNKLPIDWALSRKYDKIIYHTNQHTNNYVAKFMWEKRTSNLKNKCIYQFSPMRKLQRRLSAVLKDPNSEIDYLEARVYGRK